MAIWIVIVKYISECVLNTEKRKKKHSKNDTEELASVSHETDRSKPSKEKNIHIRYTDQIKIDDDKRQTKSCYFNEIREILENFLVALCKC